MEAHARRRVRRRSGTTTSGRAGWPASTRARFVDHTVSWELFDDTLPALDQLSADGWSHVVLSNHVPELPR